MKKVLCLIFLFTVAVPALADDKNIAQEQFDTVEINQQDAYDDFDCMADQLSERGMVPAQPKELSKTVVLLRRVGGALFMRYLAVKGWAKGMWRTLFAQGAIIHDPKCPHYIAS